MMNYYQPFLLPFLRHVPYRLASEIRQTYFVSFEDALWVLFRNKEIPKGTSVLIPEFYCMDVVDNIRNHGYVPVFYPVDKNFRINEKILRDLIRKERPSVVFILHACGLSAMPESSISSLITTSPSVLFVEDMVHRLIDPGTLRIHGTNHVVLDSLRKVSPLPGSFLYQSTHDVFVRPDSWFKEVGYLLGTSIYYSLFRSVLVTGTVFRLPRLIRIAHTRFLKTHDDLIGDSYGGYRGYPLIPLIHRFLNFQKVRSLKRKQAVLYRELLDPFLHGNHAWHFPFVSTDDLGELHVFPLVLEGARTTEEYVSIEQALQDQGIIAWFKFPDAPWSSERLVLFLPLGFHIHETDIRHIVTSLSTKFRLTGGKNRR